MKKSIEQETTGKASSASKHAYKTPEIVKYGNIVERTLGSNTGGSFEKFGLYESW